MTSPSGNRHRCRCTRSATGLLPGDRRLPGRRASTCWPALAGRPVIASQSAQRPTPAWRSICPRPCPAAHQARQKRGTPWPQPLVSHYARYFRDGNRTAYEGLVASRQQRLTRAVVMALAVDPGRPVPGERKRGSTRSSTAPSSCANRAPGAGPRTTTCSAARATLFRTGHRPYLDLGAGEVVAQLAWLDHVLGTAARRPGAGAAAAHPRGGHRACHPALPGPAGLALAGPGRRCPQLESLDPLEPHCGGAVAGG